jgi:hypothetical protein
MCFSRHELDTRSVHSDAREARPHGLHARRAPTHELAEGPSGTLTGPSRTITVEPIVVPAPDRTPAPDRREEPAEPRPAERPAEEPAPTP